MFTINQILFLLLLCLLIEVHETKVIDLRNGTHLLSSFPNSLSLTITIIFLVT